MAEYDTSKYTLPSDMADSQKLGRLRAAVLGANDGIVSVSSVVMGVAGAANDYRTIVVGGMAALVAGALSMAVGEYVSVSSQADAEKTYIREEAQDLRAMPDAELEELAREYMKLGVHEKTAHQVAKELTAKDALRAHLHVHFHLDPDNINSPLQAAAASLFAFGLGGLVPFLAITLLPDEFRTGGVVVASLVALAITGYVSARVGNARRVKAVVRVVCGGALAMAITYGIGQVFGVVIG